MIALEEPLLGLLMGISILVTSIFILSYRRSGLAGLRFMGICLATHFVLTAILLFSVVATDLLSNLDWWVVPLGDAVVLLAILIFGWLGGRIVERSA
jgi:hypothetical protein